MSTCKWIASDQPRIVMGEHYDHCPQEGCAGCWPCTARHCVSCGIAHADTAHPNTCAKCLGYVREDLTQIAEMTGVMPAEGAHRGVNAQAVALAGPTANPEAWRHRAMSAMFGRVDSAYLEDCWDERHPLWVLGTWADVWRLHLDHPTAARVTVPRAWRYLNEHLSRMAQEDEPDFGQFVSEVRGCRSHLQSVLHDQAQGDRANVACFDCGGTLERRLMERKQHASDHRRDTGGFEDFWTCDKCQRRYTVAEYNFALRAKLEEAS